MKYLHCSFIKYHIRFLSFGFKMKTFKMHFLQVNPNFWTLNVWKLSSPPHPTKSLFHPEIYCFASVLNITIPPQRLIFDYRFSLFQALDIFFFFIKWIITFSLRQIQNRRIWTNHIIIIETLIDLTNSSGIHY